MKCVPFASKCICIYVKCSFLTCTEHTSTMSPELVKLRIMTISIKTKVLIKFGTFRVDMCRIEDLKKL